MFDARLCFAGQVARQAVQLQKRDECYVPFCMKSLSIFQTACFCRHLSRRFVLTLGEVVRRREAPWKRQSEPCWVISVSQMKVSVCMSKCKSRKDESRFSRDQDLCVFDEF